MKILLTTSKTPLHPYIVNIWLVDLTIIQFGLVPAFVKIVTHGFGEMSSDWVWFCPKMLRKLRVIKKMLILNC